MLLNRLAQLLDDGFSLQDALKFMAQYEEEPLRSKIWALYDDLLEGEPFIDGLLKIGYSREALMSVILYEKNGRLSEGLFLAADILKRKNDLITQMKRHFRYPIFLLLFIFFMMYVMYFYTIPQFQTYFEQLDQELPLMTELFLILMNVMTNLAVFIPIVVIALLIIFKWYKTNRSSAEIICRLVKLPHIRQYIMKLVSLGFCMHLSPLLESGMSLKNSLHFCGENSLSLFFQHECQRISEELRNGISLDSSLKSTGFYSIELASVIQHSQGRNTLGRDLYHYQQYLYKNLLEFMQKRIHQFQFSLYFVVGVFILVLFLSILLPMYQMMVGG